MQRSEEIDPGVPLTRATTAGMPAEKSLVRASEQPSTMPPEYLLRPAGETTETPAEQLLRPL